MKNLVFALLLLVAVIAGVGVYRGWFTVNKAQIEQDEVTAKQEMHDLEQNVQEKTSDPKSPVNDHK